jgi:NitT/TauT family transport system substrate-binding protein
MKFPTIRSIYSVILACFIPVFLPTSTLAQTLRVGVLPVLDTLPLQVAVQDRLFDQEGLRVELVSFGSALERDAAMQAGQLDGYFGDLLNTVLLIQNGVPIRIVTVAYATQPGQRMFALLTAPSVPGLTPGSSKSLKVGISTATIIDFLLDPMLTQAGLRRNQVTPMDVKKIPIRLQMLLTSQLDAALLPEPLVSIAEQQGARVIATDEALNLPVTLVSLLHDRLQQGPDILERFLRAYALAVRRIAESPDGYREILVHSCGLPEVLRNTFRMPKYPSPQFPSREAVQAVQDWMRQQTLISEALPYHQMVPSAAALPNHQQGNP